MKITNVAGLPAVYVRLAEKGNYQRGGIHVTDLVNLNKRSILKNRHFNEIEEDVMDHLARMRGNAHHALMEQGAGINDLAEEGGSIEINGHRVYGRADLYEGDDKRITDWKHTSVWKLVIKDEGNRQWFEDVERQLNYYAVIYRSMGFPVDELMVCLDMEGWQKSKAKHDANYPPYRVATFVFKPKPDAEVRAEMAKRIERLLELRSRPDDLVPTCSQSERMNKGDQYAVMKKGNKRAAKVHTVEAEANAHAAKMGELYSVEKRAGVDMACLEYCSARQFCKHFQDNYAGKEFEGFGEDGEA